MLTKEEAYNLVEDERAKVGMRKAAKETIDAIYASVGSCETCEWYAKDSMYCCSLEAFITLTYCSEFTPKEGA